MPKLVSSVPAYRKHRPSGQAVVTLSSRDYYLGPHGTKVSKREYDRLVSEWLQNGRQLRPSDISGKTFTVVELIVAYLHFARTYYRKNGRPTSERKAIIYALRYVKLLYGRKPVEEFGPIALQVIIQKMVEDGMTRGVINQNAGRIKRMFRWGVSQELIPATVSHALSTVRGLAKGRTDARETGPVMPVDEAIVAATIEHLPDVVADMVQVQQLTGMRPAEVCIMRPVDIDRSDEIWLYRPSSHKTEHHRGRERVVFVGPKVQSILLNYLARDATAYCFRPCDSEAKRRILQHAARRVPLRYGNRPGTNRTPKPKRSPGERYDVASYRRAIHRACDRAFLHPVLNIIPRGKLTAEQLADLRKWQSTHR